MGVENLNQMVQQAVVLDPNGRPFDHNMQSIQLVLYKPDGSTFDLLNLPGEVDEELDEETGELREQIEALEARVVALEGVGDN